MDSDDDLDAWVTAVRVPVDVATGVIPAWLEAALPAAAAGCPLTATRPPQRRTTVRPGFSLTGILPFGATFPSGRPSLRGDSALTSRRVRACSRQLVPHLRASVLGRTSGREPPPGGFRPHNQSRTILPFGATFPSGRHSLRGDSEPHHLSLTGSLSSLVEFPPSRVISHSPEFTPSRVSRSQEPPNLRSGGTHRRNQSRALRGCHSLVGVPRPHGGLIRNSRPILELGTHAATIRAAPSAITFRSQPALELLHRSHPDWTL